jgi:hypothetical protein
VNKKDEEEMEESEPTKQTRYTPNSMYFSVKKTLDKEEQGRKLNKKFEGKGKPDAGFLHEGDERRGRNHNKFSTAW